MTHAGNQTDLTRLRVLLVDDNAALRGALRVSLHAFGCGQVIEADTVDKALDVMKTRNIDLVITDWKMRPRTGIDFVRTLRRPDANCQPWVPVIMLSAYSDAERIAEARRAGIDTFLVKPFTAASLAASLRETLIQDSGLCDSIPQAHEN